MIHKAAIADPAIATARQVLYRFAALSFLDPRNDSWGRLSALRDDPLPGAAADLVRSLPEATPDRLTPVDRPLEDLDPRSVWAKFPKSSAALTDEFDRTFGLVVSSACPPHETEYINGKLSFQRSNALADISGFYRAFGVTVSRSHPERPDHIVPELEFMAVLGGLAIQASEAKFPTFPTGDERLGTCLAAQERFLREHLLWWAPALAKLLQRESEGGFYEAAGVFLAALLTAERSLFGVPHNANFPTPSGIERPEECEGCLLGG